MSSTSPNNGVARFSRDFDLNIAADEAEVDNEAVEKAGSDAAAGFRGKTDIDGENVKSFGSREVSSVSMGLGSGTSERNAAVHGVGSVGGIFGTNGGFRIAELGFPKKKGRGRPRKAAAAMKTRIRIGTVGRVDDKVVFDVDVANGVGGVDGVVETVGEAAKTPDSIGRFGDLNDGNGSSVGGVEGEMVKKRGRGRPPQSTISKVVHNEVVANEICSSVIGNVVDSVDGAVQLKGETSMKKGRRVSLRLTTATTPDDVGRSGGEVVDYGDANNEIGSSVVGNGVAVVDDAALVEEETSMKRGRGRPPKSATTKTQDSIGRLDDKVVFDTDVTNEISSSVIGNVVDGFNCVAQVEGVTNKKKGRGRPRKFATMDTLDSLGVSGIGVGAADGGVLVEEVASKKRGRGRPPKFSKKRGRGRLRKFAFMKTPGSSGVASNGVGAADGAFLVKEATSKKIGRGRPPKFTKKRGRGRPPKSVVAAPDSIGRLDDKVVFNAHVTNEIKDSSVIGNIFAVVDGAIQVEGETAKKKGRGRPPKSVAIQTPDSIERLHDMVVFDAHVTNEIKNSSATGNIFGGVDGVIQVEGETSKKKGRGRPPKFATTKTSESIGRLDDKVVSNFDATNDIEPSSVIGNAFGTVDCVIQVEGETIKKTQDNIGRFPVEVLAYGDVNNEICSGGAGYGVGAADGVMFVEDATSKKRGRGRPPKSTTLKTPDSIGRLDDNVACNADLTSEVEPSIVNGNLFGSVDGVVGTVDAALFVEGVTSKKRGRGTPANSAITNIQDSIGRLDDNVVCDADVTNETEPSSVVGNAFGVVDSVIQVEGETTTEKSRGSPPKFATIKTLDSIGRFSDEAVDGNGVCASDGVVCVQDGTSKKRGRENPSGATKTQNGSDGFNEEVVVVNDTSNVFGSGFAGNGVGAAGGIVQVMEEEAHKKRGRGTSGAAQLEPVRTLISLQEEAEESIPTELILAFGDSCVLPSAAELEKILGQYGPLRETETLIVQSLKIAKVVFKKRADAEVAEAALRGTGEYSLFGQACIGYRLDPIGPRLSNPGGIQLLEPKRFLIALQDEECMPTELVLAFGVSCTLPSVADLVQIFGKFGPLREGETQVVENIKVARVVFKRRVDAEVAGLALSSAGKYSFFKQASLEGYKLRNLESRLQNFSLHHGP